MKELQELTAFCEQNPELTFWRALLGWIQQKYDQNFIAVIVMKRFVDGNKVYDTANWTGEDSPMVLFKDEIK